MKIVYLVENNISQFYDPRARRLSNSERIHCDAEPSPDRHQVLDTKLKANFTILFSNSQIKFPIQCNYKPLF